MCLENVCLNARFLHAKQRPLGNALTPIVEPTKEGGNMGDKGEGTARDSDSLYPEGDYCPLSANVIRKY